MSGQKKVTEAEVRKAVQRALRRVLKDIENEPALIIMPDDSNNSLSDQAVNGIRKWLFDRG
jgi:hypothetical protein